jgi:hypothetical protein
MTSLVSALAGKYPSLLLLQIEAEVHEEITESFEIDNVPSFIVLRVSYVPVDPPPPNAHCSFSADVLYYCRAIHFWRVSRAQMPSLSPTSSRNM